ncbi:LOW QUALITY PROTEIN: rhythmically expressed gene 5 protein [Aphis gossypii]|uniref:LOW QUALITY PROTEIN: rhythmically expressed gene 5 protein n=1 Tax=Aphis gossypii TaxID=80765 RepID=UPI002159199E|nr:LOW QUALITY PROTEIN: rhythmically expressed gene 5 protein [Aphis gossypii]
MRTYALLWPLAAFLVTRTSGSAIPMWEFLSRGEKMSHLFNMFVKQVADYCDSSSMPDCNKVLLIYGLTNLAKMGDDSLDKMDPYQRGSRIMIWESMMKGGFFTSQTTDKSEQELNDPLETSGGNDLGSASNNVEEIATPPGGYIIGPMVVRVMPDGRPVPGDSQRPLPKDEDAEEFIAMRSKPMPSMNDMLVKENKQHKTGLL